jgi:hypothetical protein
LLLFAGLFMCVKLGLLLDSCYSSLPTVLGFLIEQSSIGGSASYA